jgi:hypothetical protein
MYTRTFEATSNGEASVDLYGYDSDIEVVADPSCRKAYVEVYTQADSGSSVEAIDALPETRGNDLRVRLPESAGRGGSVIVSDGDIVIGNSGSMSFTSGRWGFTSMMSGVGGDSDMVVNGNRIQVRGGRTWFNGVEVTAEGGQGGPAGDPPMPIHFRAVVPYGSYAKAETYSGNITTSNVPGVKLKTYKGDVTAIGLAQESWVETYKGDVTVGAVAGQRPQVYAETYKGNITALDDDVRLRPKTYKGEVRYPR